MLGIVVLGTVLPIFVCGSGDGNIKLLEEEISNALKACNIPDSKESGSTGSRQRRSDDYNGYGEDPYGDRTPKIDGMSRTDINQYGHERRNTSDMKDQMHVLNATDYDYGGYGIGNAGEKFVNTIPRPANGGSYNDTNNLNNYTNYYNNFNNSLNRTKRNDPLLNKEDGDQCLSQCVFANLQVVDTRGIPREAELWNKVQSSVTSQQSRSALRDQIRACFQELQSEAEDNGCSYSNKLERCLMLRFFDRIKAETKESQNSQNNQKQ